MSRVLQAIDSIHQAGIYCLALVPSNQLPKTPLGGIHVSETRQRFLDGCLHPETLLMCPHSYVINLPKPREQQVDVGPAAVFVGNIVQGARIAGAKGRDIGPCEENKGIYLIDILRHRAVTSPDHILHTQLNSKGTEVDSVTCLQLLRKAERIAALLIDSGHVSPGDHVALVFPHGVDLIAAFLRMPVRRCCASLYSATTFTKSSSNSDHCQNDRRRFESDCYAFNIISDQASVATFILSSEVTPHLLRACTARVSNCVWKKRGN
ncbi:hypothetical protein AB6A40_009915 [Gnathostoma spinigerum]|uniref:AMP-dependent synthetase/ligase domain-containing protein n=1 Tax=Gnathostoma spinigerum TaxID=75299 RepID=A0ABD6EV34_9BILA